MLIIRTMCQSEDGYTVRRICYNEDDAPTMRMMMTASRGWWWRFTRMMML